MSLLEAARLDVWTRYMKKVYALAATYRQWTSVRVIITRILKTGRYLKNDDVEEGFLI